jgi:hypothetical protein
MTAKEVSEIESVKRLLILLLLKLGATSQEIGAAVGTDSSGIRRLVPIRKNKKLGFVR